jgi:hypothetical protein
MLDHIKLRLDEIVTVYRRRHSEPEYLTNIKECIELAQTANNTLQRIFAHLVALDGSHIMALWYVAHDIDPTCFSTSAYRDLLNQLLSTIRAVDLLAKALPFATGVSAEKPGRGAPPIPYTPIARELVELWEFVTSEPWQGKEDVRLATSVPVAKKQGSKKDDEASQESTEFCRLVFEMIDPKIKLPNIRTAINNALDARKIFRMSPRLREHRNYFTTGDSPEFVRYVTLSRKPKGASKTGERVKKKPP